MASTAPEAAAARAAAAAAPTSEHYRRLQALESAVVGAIEAAARCMGGLSRASGADAAELRAEGEAFLRGVAEAQRLLLAAARGAAADRGLEASAYQPMVKATVAGEKVAALLAHLRALERRLAVVGGGGPAAGAGARGRDSDR